MNTKWGKLNKKRWKLTNTNGFKLHITPPTKFQAQLWINHIISDGDLSDFDEQFEMHVEMNIPRQFKKN